MSKKQTSMRLGIGATSIFMVFVILVMCVLAVLSYLRANSYYESARRQADMTSAYYQTEAKIMGRYYTLNDSNLENALTEGLVYQEDGLYIMEENINDEQMLKLSFQKNGENFEITGLQTVNLED